MKKNKIIKFDVMLDGRFIKTLRYEYCPLFALQIDELAEYVVKKIPTLRGKNFTIAF